MQLVLDTNGLIVKKRNNSFWVVSKQARRMISPHRINSIAVTADCLISTAAIKLAAKHGIPIYFFNMEAKLDARVTGPSYGSIATIRRKQVFFALTTDATEWMIRIFKLKAKHQNESLKYIERRKPSLKEEYKLRQNEIENIIKRFDSLNSQSLTICSNKMMGIEGRIARVYWRLISLSLPNELKFDKRSRRPARDPFNAALNYLYGMLYGVVGSAILAAGLDTHLGFLHADEYNKTTLTFDFIEPFRPWVDQLLVEKCLDNEIKEDFFTIKEEAYYLDKKGRRYCISAFNDFMEERRLFNGRQLSRKNHIYRYIGEFAQYLLNKEF